MIAREVGSESISTGINLIHEIPSSILFDKEISGRPLETFYKGAGNLALESAFSSILFSQDASIVAEREAGAVNLPPEPNPTPRQTNSLHIKSPRKNYITRKIHTWSGRTSPRPRNED